MIFAHNSDATVYLFNFSRAPAVVEVLELVAQSFMLGFQQLPYYPLSHVFNCVYNNFS